MTTRAVFFDVDFTLIYPGPTFRGEGYQHPSIFRAALDLVNVPAEASVMVGDSVRQDVEGALAAGMRA